MTSWGAVEFEPPHPAVRIQHDAVVGFSRIEEISSLTRPWGLRRVRALCPCRTQAGQRRGVALRRRLVLLALALAATSVAVTAVPSLAAQSDHIPKGLQVPEGHRLVLGALGKGVQIYDLQRRRCLGSLREPAAAILKGDATVALHYAGPTWQSVKDGSEVVARPEPERRVVVPAPYPERDIPWLRLETIGTGPGLFGQVVHGHLQLLDARARQCLRPDASRRTNRGAGPQPSDQQRTATVNARRVVGWARVADLGWGRGRNCMACKRSCRLVA